MENIFSYQSSKDHYTADACIVWCFDDRFSKLLETFVEERKYTHVDLVKIAGGAKEIDFVLDQIGKSITLHHTPRVVLMVHSECGAYGGSQDPAFYEAELQKALGAVKNQFPQVEIEALFADFQDIKQI